MSLTYLFVEHLGFVESCLSSIWYFFRHYFFRYSFWSISVSTTTSGIPTMHIIVCFIVPHRSLRLYLRLFFLFFRLNNFSSSILMFADSSHSNLLLNSSIIFFISVIVILAPKFLFNSFLKFSLLIFSFCSHSISTCLSINSFRFFI